MKLLIDIGNSRVKRVCLRDTKLVSPEVISWKTQDRKELYERLLHIEERPEQVYIANVAGQDVGEGIAASIKSKWQLTPIFAAVEPEFAGVTNAYHDVAQLGIDRWLAVIAAWTRYRSPVCIVSCGTAVTVDGVSESGQHLGGLIIPGLHMMQSALISETGGIHAEPGDNFALEFGKSTAECINSGSVRAIVSLVENVTAEMSGRYGEALSRVISGGYAGQINALMAGKFDHDPDLVLRGLALVAEKSS